MRNEPVHRPCFVCLSTEGVQMFAQELEVCGLGSVCYALRCCQNCGLVLQDPAVSPRTMQRQYAMFSNYLAFHEGDPPLSSTAGRMLDLVSRALPTAGRIYDVGAAAGFMLWHFRARGWTIGGCDPSPAAVAQAEARYGIELDIGSCEHTLRSHAGLDLVTMSHVLEHIYDPTSVLQAVRTALADGGHLLMEVPCLTAPERNGPGLFMMEHLNYFEPTSLKNLLGAAGFEVLQQTITLDYFPFPVITILARKAGPIVRSAPASAFDDNLLFLQSYDQIETEQWRAIDVRLEIALAEGEEVFVWGAGLHTSALLSRTGIERRAKILAITDRDSQKHGYTLGPYTIVEPAAALQSGQKIVISSHVSETAIAAGLLDHGVASERIVRLYG